MKRSVKIALFSVLTLMTLFINALGITPAQAILSATEAVSKNGVAGTIPSGGVGSQTIDWTIDYDLTSAAPLQNLSLNDTWSAGQTLVPGSVQTPGGTWSYSQPNSTSLAFTNALVAPGGKGAAISFYPGLSGPVTFPGGGDGFNPALTTSGKMLGINHHISNAGIWCYDMVAGAVCPNYKMFPGINTSNNPFTRAIGNKIYIAGATNPGGNTVPGRIFCWDSDTDSLCGTSPTIGAYDRMEIANGLIYTLLSTGEVDCYDPGNALAQCAGYPVEVNVPAYGGNVGNGLLVAGDSLYMLNYVGDLNCLDTSTLAFCAGWSSIPIDGPLAFDLLFPRLNAGGDITGVCQAGAGTAATCYDLDGSNATTVSGIAPVTAGVYDYASDSSYFGSRVWFAGYGNGLACWDWATNAVCTGSGLDGNGRVTADLGLPYGVTHDNFCLYTFGDAGTLFSVDPVSGETPCTKAGGEVTVDIDDFYSTTPPGTVAATWDKIFLTDVNLTSGVDFSSFQVWLTNPSDATVFGPVEMIDGSGVVDISSVSATIRALTLHVEASFAGGATGINRKAWLSFASTTPVQFTYQTTITCAGTTQNHTNTITTNLDPHSDQAAVSKLCVNDVTAPTVSSSVRAGSNPTSASTVDFTVTFSEAVTGVDATDFSLATTGVTGASITSVSGVGTTYTVAVNTGSGDGTIRLNVLDNDTIVDAALNPLGGTGATNGAFTSGETYSVDKIPPTVVSSLRVDPSPTNAASVNFTVLFTETVTGVDITDFRLTTTGVTGASITGVSGTGTTYTVTVNTGSGDGTIRLNVLDNDTIVDAVLNPLGGAGAANGVFTSGETYSIDKAAPTVVASVRADPSPTHAASVNFTVTFIEAMTGVDTADFSLTTTGVTGASVTSISGAGTTYTVTVNTGSGDGTIRLNVLDNDTIVDAVLNPLGGIGSGNGAFTSGETYSIDKTAPTLVASLRVDPSPTHAASVNFTVTFIEAVTGVDTADFSLATTGSITGAAVSSVSGSGTTYTVTVTTGSGTGTIRLDAVDNDSIVDLASNPLGGVGAGNGDFTSGEAYVVRLNYVYLPIVVRH